MAVVPSLGNVAAGSMDLKYVGPPAGSNPTKTSDRKGVFTSGIISVHEKHQTTLFFTGHRHAGENLTAVLKQRAYELGRPLHMCDALSCNLPDLPEDLQTIVAHCLAHARRQFVDVAMNFPQECLHVLLILKAVYTNEPSSHPVDWKPWNYQDTLLKTQVP